MRGALAVPGEVDFPLGLWAVSRGIEKGEFKSLSLPSKVEKEKNYSLNAGAESDKLVFLYQAKKFSEINEKHVKKINDIFLKTYGRYQVEIVGHSCMSSLITAVTWICPKLKLSERPERAGRPPRPSWQRAAPPKLWLHEAEAEAGPAAPSRCPRLPSHVALLSRAADHVCLTRWFIFRTRASFDKRHQVFLPFCFVRKYRKLRFTENMESGFTASPRAFVS